MKIVNTSEHIHYVTRYGKLNPGNMTGDLSAYKMLIKELQRLVSYCGDSLAIILSDTEKDIITKIFELDEKGRTFDRNSLSKDALEDPTGEKRAEKSRLDAQQAEIDARAKRNAEAAQYEAMINGEISERKPVGPATMKGEKVEPSMLKSGFEAIMEANAKIEANKKINVGEMLDPIGEHLKNNTPAEKAVEDIKDKDVEQNVAEPTVAKTSNEMDRVASEVASGIAQFGPVENDGKKRNKKRKQ